MVIYYLLTYNSPVHIDQDWDCHKLCPAEEYQVEEARKGVINQGTHKAANKKRVI